MNKLLIIGSGSQARYVIDTINENGIYKIAGIVDIEQVSNAGKIVNGVKIVCFWANISDHFSNTDAQVIVAFGNNGKKREIVGALKAKGFKFAQSISNHAHISPFTKIGEGCIINPATTIMPNAKLGCHVIVHSHSVIEHDNIIEDYVNIGPGVSFGGSVHVKEGAYIYTGAIIIPKIIIGKEAIVGAGAVVIRNVANGDTVVGNPAKSVVNNK